MTRLSAVRGVCGCLALCLPLAGCRHKPQPVAIQVPPPSPVPLAPAPEPKTPPQVAQIPTQPPPLIPVNPPVQKRVKKPKKKTDAPQVAALTTPAAPGTSAGSPAAAENVIGALSSGGDQVSELYGRAKDLIAATEKRLSGLPADFRDKEKEQLLRVENFQKQAQAALKAGDVDGAYTLATKAKLLLDDLQK